ncbi:BgTH12-03734 [Blumeria graminis f. sp. triticale]|uniref:Bgt-4368 n=4 Tax=Blumeria TaxID=34372 RepID=A0A061HLP3_BLUGR|nr:hypothetical protein BGT96224_4368 [Blumeria graminis f. sp. tritici 96224]CAD6499624.1 BgTH12-03734 [Blumeria graminis f. sp. triticale]CCU80202.1 hypothetical protein BGHDH14_bgh04877 [Blumeria hordei DH14]VCU39762.1 Bgt-4368 [Blumeria graminis f. sp. tritici]
MSSSTSDTSSFQNSSSSAAPGRNKPPYTTSSHGDVNSPYAPHVALLRCSRCVKSVETVSRGVRIDETGTGMISYGMNLWYCERCARIVGYK